MFYNCAQLTHVVLNEGLETLGDRGLDEHYRGTLGVFEQSAIESVNIPLSLREIGHRTFYGCRSLRSVELPEGLQTLWNGCFRESGL